MKLNPVVWAIPVGLLAAAVFFSLRRRLKKPVASVTALLSDVYFFWLLSLLDARIAQLRRYLSEVTSNTLLDISAMPKPNGLISFITGAAEPTQLQMENAYAVLRQWLIGCVAVTVLLVVIECIRLFRAPKS